MSRCCDSIEVVGGAQGAHGTDTNCELEVGHLGPHKETCNQFTVTWPVGTLDPSAQQALQELEEA